MQHIYQRGGFLAALFLLFFSRAWAVDIDGVQPAALDQPRINAYLSRDPTGDPLAVEDIGFGGGFNIEAFLDTGASGLLLSNGTADLLGVNRARFPEPSGPLVTFEDVGVGGSDEFNVSEPLHVGIAPFHPEADIDNLNTFSSVYNQTFADMRLQVGPLNADPNPLLENLDVFGMPVMQGKVVVMDPRPLDTFLDTMRTYLYDQGTPFQSATEDSNPGIPLTNRHVQLSYGSFDRFTQLTPTGAPGPTLAHNPFIGPNPVAAIDPTVPAGDAPGVKISLGGQSTTGSFLLDTGAAASTISQQMAANLNVRYVEGTFGTDSPVLEIFDPANPESPGTVLQDQFSLTLGGIGGTSSVAGFYLDSLLLRTTEGNAGDDNDPDHIRYLNAPVLVGDITVVDPITSQSLTLDGIFGMNFMVANAFVSLTLPLPTIDNLTPGAFNWIVFDEAQGMLGLDLKNAPPAFVSGDLNGDGVLNNFDIQPFELALLHPETFQQRYPQIGDFAERGDLNGDNMFDDFDVLAFERALTGEPSSGSSSAVAAAAVPEPATSLLLLLGATCLLWAGRRSNRTARTC